MQLFLVLEMNQYTENLLIFLCSFVLAENKHRVVVTICNFPDLSNKELL